MAEVSDLTFRIFISPPVLHTVPFTGFEENEIDGTKNCALIVITSLVIPLIILYV